MNDRSSSHAPGTDEYKPSGKQRGSRAQCPVPARPQSRESRGCFYFAVSWLWNLIRSIPNPVLTLLLGIVVFLNYLALYVVYYQFYVGFGLRPADVGLSKVRLLQESIAGALLFPATAASRHHVYVFTGFCLVLAAAVISWLVCAMPRPHQWMSRVVFRELLACVFLALLASFIVLLADGYRYAGVQANQLGKEVRKDGKIVIAWVWPGGNSDLPLLDVQAIPADVVATKGSELPELTNGCVLYLGQANAQAILYDVRRQKVALISTADATIAVRPNSEDNNKYPNSALPKNCTRVGARTLPRS